MLLAQGFAMEDAIQLVVVAQDVQDAVAVLALVQVALMQELRDAVVVLALALDSALDAVLVQHLVQVDAKVVAEELVELHPANLHVTGHVVVALDVDHVVVHVMDAIAVLVDALLLVEEVVQVARLAVDAVVVTDAKDAVVTVSLLAVAHAGQLPSNFYI